MGETLGGGYAFPNGFTLGISGTFAVDTSGDYILVFTPEVGVGTPGLGVFGRGVFGYNNDIEDLKGLALSVSGTFRSRSGSASMPIGEGTGSTILEGGFGLGDGASITAGWGIEKHRGNIVDDISTIWDRITN